MQESVTRIGFCVTHVKAALVVVVLPRNDHVDRLRRIASRDSRRVDSAWGIAEIVSRAAGVICVISTAIRNMRFVAQNEKVVKIHRSNSPLK